VGRKDIQAKFSAETCVAGYDWTARLLSRYPELSITKTEAISYERVMCLNQSQTNGFCPVRLLGA
jgi:hypothetical protein